MMNSLVANLFLLFFSCSSLVCLSSAISNHDLQKFTSEEQVFGLFQLWQKEHGRVYSNLQEEANRFQIFQSNLKYIKEMNAKRKSPSESRLGLNKFADLSPQEFGEIYLHQINPSINWASANLKDDYSSEGLPDSLDWRAKGAVTEVKDQGNCESHWAFSVVGAIEGINAINTGKLIDLSAQELVDCDPASKGCAGGYYFNAFGWVINNGGVDTAANYPYTATTGSCKNGIKAVSINNLYVVDGTESGLLSTVAQQPVTTSVNAIDLHLYSGGIYGGDNCTKNSTYTNLVVLIVGYGSENGEDYWIVKNTWGKDWGEDGYFRIKRNATGWPNGVCGINSAAGFPTQDTSSSLLSSTSATERITASNPHLFQA